jgi:hypothetical protein
MKSLKFFSAVVIAAAFLFSFSSCKKDGDTKNGVTKDQLLGKWTFVIQYNGTTTYHANLKASGGMEVDQPPFDDVADILLLWDLSKNNFTAHIDINGITNYWKLTGTVDAAGSSIAGTLVANDGVNPPITAVFTMAKL